MKTKAERVGLIAEHGITFLDIVTAAELNADDAHAVRDLCKQTVAEVGALIGKCSPNPEADVGRMVMALSASVIVAMDDESECAECDGC